MRIPSLGLHRPARRVLRMKLRSASFLGLAAGIGLLVQSATLHAQPAATPNHVLELDGTNSCVELPPNIFNDLTEATVEGWVKWSRLGNSMRFFDFGRRGYEEEGQSMALGTGIQNGLFDSLSFELWDASRTAKVRVLADRQDPYHQPVVPYRGGHRTQRSQDLPRRRSGGPE